MNPANAIIECVHGGIFCIVQYPGEKIIHRSRDEFGDLVVTESALVRSLYFGNEKRQSAMFLQHSGLLVMEYTQAMMLALLFRRKPEKVFCLGLGGGSIAKFILRASPRVILDVVELREMVIRVAQAYFAVPADDCRLRLIHGDGYRYFGGEHDQGVDYDLMFLDAFDHEGPVDRVSNLSFIEKAYLRLDERGVLCINLWNRSGDGFHQKLRQLKSLCGGAVLHNEIGRRNSNALIFCFKQREMMLQLRRYEAVSNDLRREFGINFHKYYSRLYKQNVPVMQRLFKAAV